MCITINELLHPLHDEDTHVLDEYVHLLHQDDPMRFKNASIGFGSKNWSSNMYNGPPKLLQKGADRNQLIFGYSFYCERLVPTTL